MVNLLQFHCSKMVLSFSFPFRSSFDGHEEESSAADGLTKDSKSSLWDVPAWLSSATPDEFLVSLLNFSLYFSVFNKSKHLFCCVLKAFLISILTMHFVDCFSGNN